MNAMATIRIFSCCSLIWALGARAQEGMPSKIQQADPARPAVVMGQGERARTATTSDLILQAQDREAVRKTEISQRIEKSRALEDERRQAEALRGAQAKGSEAQRKEQLANVSASAPKASSLTVGPAMANKSGMGEAEAILGIAAIVALFCGLGALAARRMLSNRP